MENEAQLTTPFFVTGGTLPPDASSYVERQADKDLLTSLLAGEYCYVLNSRQMGKSSLSVRTIGKLQEAGVKTAFIDLTRIGAQNVSPEQWYAGLLAETGRALGLRSEFLKYWKEQLHLPPVQRYFTAIREIALSPNSYPLSPMVVFVDEIDAVRSLSFSADEFFAAVRACHNARMEDPVYNQLTFCLVGSATPSDLISDTRMSPFNVGKRIELRDFTRPECAPLNAGLITPTTPMSPNAAQPLLDRVFYWTNGHPYLTQSLCAAAVEASVKTVAEIDHLVETLFLEAKARERNPNLADVSNRVLSSYLDPNRRDEHRASILDLYSKVLRPPGTIEDDETNPLVALLKLAGITRSNGGKLSVRNRIYERVFDRKWIEESMPDAELRRQKAAYRRGLARALAGSAVIVTVMIGLLAFATKQRNAASENARVAQLSAVEANRNLYFANMNLIQRDWEVNNLDHILELLKLTSTYVNKGFEWGYWNRMCHLELLTLNKHKKRVTSISYSPDGSRIVTGSVDNSAMVWDSRTGGLLITLVGHKDRVTSVTFSPDGKRIVTGSADHTVKVWDASSGRNTITIKGHSDRVTSVAFSPNGKWIATGSFDKSAVVWDAQSGHRLVTLKGHADKVTSVAFSKNNRQVVTASEDKTAKMWDISTGKLLMTFEGHTNVVESAAISPDGVNVVTGSWDNSAKVWDVRTGRVKLTFAEHSDCVNSVVYSSDGERVASGSWDNSLIIWDARTGRNIRTLRGHTERITSVAFSPDGSRVASASDDHSAKVWDINAGNEYLALVGHSNTIYAAAFSPNRMQLVTGSQDMTARIWDLNSGQTIKTLRGHSNTIECAAFSPDGKYIVTGSVDKTAKVWNVESGALISTLVGHADEVLSVAFAPTGSQVVTGSADKTAKIWDWNQNRLYKTITGFAYPVSSVAYSPDGRWIATGTQDSTEDSVAMLWDAKKGTHIRSFKGHSEWISAIAFSPDGSRLATGSDDHTAKVWNAQTGQEQLTLKGHTNAIMSIKFSPDGRQIVTGAKDNTARVWDSKFGKELLSLRDHAETVISASFSPDGKRIATVSGNQAAIWFSDSRDWNDAMRESNEAVGHYFRANALLVAKQYDEANAHYGIALRLRPSMESQAFIDNLAWSEYLAGHADRAVECARRGTSKNTQDSNVRMLLGFYYAVDNKWTNAKSEFDKVLQTPAVVNFDYWTKVLRNAKQRRVNRSIEAAIQYLIRAQRTRNVRIATPPV